MAKKLNEKYNDSCVKLFQFIKMLYDGDVDFKRVIEHFSDGNYDGTSNTHVTLNKYLNAMKIFGMKVKKIKNSYKMLSPLYKIHFNLEDLKSIEALKESEQLLPEGKHKKNLEEFLRALEIRFDESTQSMQETAKSTQNLHLQFYHSEMVQQVKLCEKYCQDQHKLEIIYHKDTGEEIDLICSPLELVYLKRRICLKTLGTNGSRIYEIPIENILSIKQLPGISSSTSIPTTVVYRIKNRLAKNYKIRDWEKIETIEANGSKVIVNKDEDLNNLINRLMRYGRECEVISPKFIREEMIETINKTLSNYQ